MNFRKWTNLLMIVVAVGAISGAESLTSARFAPPRLIPQIPGTIAFITAEELKAKMQKGEAVTIIDVRASSDIANSEIKIKGAIHVKLRRLKSRLSLPPLNGVSRNSEVILYCACPNDEASIRGVEILQESGFKRARALKGGWVAWKQSHGEVESKPKG